MPQLYVYGNGGRRYFPEKEASTDQATRSFYGNGAKLVLSPSDSLVLAHGHGSVNVHQQIYAIFKGNNNKVVKQFVSKISGRRAFGDVTLSETGGKGIMSQLMRYNEFGEVDPRGIKYGSNGSAENQNVKRSYQTILNKLNKNQDVALTAKNNFEALELIFTLRANFDSHSKNKIGEKLVYGVGHPTTADITLFNERDDLRIPERDIVVWVDSRFETGYILENKRENKKRRNKNKQSSDSGLLSRISPF